MHAAYVSDRSTGAKKCPPHVLSQTLIRIFATSMVANNTETSPLLKSNSDNTSANNGSNTRVSKRSSQRRGGLYDSKTGYQTTNTATTLTTKISNDTTSSASTSVVTNIKKPPAHRGSSLVNATLQPIENNNNNRPTISRNEQHIGSATSIQQQRCTVIQQDDKPITPTSFYYNPILNPTIQRYYKFTSTKSTPFIALYKRPLEIYPESTLTEHEILIQRQYQNKPGSKGNQSDTTGLLTRSMVLPSHGTDPSGKWILVSVGGRKFISLYLCAYEYAHSVFCVCAYVKLISLFSASCFTLSFIQARGGLEEIYY